MPKFKALPILAGAAGLLVTGLLVGTPAQADPFNLTSCHISTGCPAPGTVFGTVNLTTAGTGVHFDVVLNNGSRFVETGAGGGELFLFNDSLGAGSQITNISATLDGATVDGGTVVLRFGRVLYWACAAPVTAKTAANTVAAIRISCLLITARS